MHQIGRRIREYRTKRKVTQAQLARELGVQFQTVSKWETGNAQPGIDLLPPLADALGVSIDDLFGRGNRCDGPLEASDRELMLGYYARTYGPEAGPWNLSVENKYLEYRFAAFFEEHFMLSEGMRVCNIGIGAGVWDRYLTYRITKGHLTSIDRLEVCCRQLEAGLALEGNPCDVRVVCGDAMEQPGDGSFDLVTVVGSTERESGLGMALLEKAMEMTGPGGALYYQTLDGGVDLNDAVLMANRKRMKLSAFMHDTAYGFDCRYFKFERL